MKHICTSTCKYVYPIRCYEEYVYQLKYKFVRIIFLYILNLELNLFYEKDFPLKFVKNNNKSIYEAI